MFFIYLKFFFNLCLSKNKSNFIFTNWNKKFLVARS